MHDNVSAQLHRVQRDDPRAVREAISRETKLEPGGMEECHVRRPEEKHR
jgi:hypothetical protein